jgi:hypothetical protein
MHQTCKIVDRVSPLQHPRPASRLPQSYRESALLGTILVCCVPSLRLVLRIDPLDPCLLRNYQTSKLCQWSDPGGILRTSHTSLSTYKTSHRPSKAHVFTCSSHTHDRRACQLHNEEDYTTGSIDQLASKIAVLAAASGRPNTISCS